MPEGHTIHRLARDHRRALGKGSVAVSSPQGRFAAGAALLDGQSVRRIEAYGKHLFYWWAGGEVLHVHLGLFGKFRAHPPAEAPLPRPTVRLRMANATAVIDLTGPTDCSVGGRDERDRIVARLGPDPLRRDADPAVAIARWRAARAPIGAVLLDQSKVAGVGNVYRAEALFVTGVHPARRGCDLTHEEAATLWATVTAMLRQGVADNRIITVARHELAGARSRVTRDQAMYVYKRDTCRRCASPIERWELANRWAYACATCQR